MSVDEKDGRESGGNDSHVTSPFAGVKPNVFLIR
jgi:hypothetical protein